MYKKAFANEND